MFQSALPEYLRASALAIMPSGLCPWLAYQWIGNSRGQPTARASDSTYPAPTIDLHQRFC
jgi:hypothetical protein